MERCLKKFELHNRLLDQTLIDFDEERKNFHEKYHDKNDETDP